MSAHRHAQSDEHGLGLPLLHQLIYCSRAAPGLEETAVARIIETARRVNPAHGITGLLVSGSGMFFQWIEGPRDNVTLLMDRIRNDPRHEQVVMLSETEEVRERLFPDWDMELVTASDIRDVLLDALTDAWDDRSTEALNRMLAQLDADGLGLPVGEA